MTDVNTELARIAGLADAATRGPWARVNSRGSVVIQDDTHGYVAQTSGLNWGPNAAFIVDARTTVPWLIKQVRLRDAAIADVAGLDFAEIVAHVDDSGGWFNIFPEEARQIGDAIRTAITRALTPEGDRS